MPRLSRLDPAHQLQKSLSQPDAAPNAEARHSPFDELANRVGPGQAFVKEDIHPALRAGASDKGGDRKTATAAIQQIEKGIAGVAWSVHPSQSSTIRIVVQH